MYCIGMRAINIDPITLYHEVKKTLSEIKSIEDFLEILSEVNDLKNFIIENIREGLMETDIYEEHLVIEKLLNEFLIRCEEKVQFELNALSSYVDGIEKTIIMLPPNGKGDTIPPNILPHTDTHIPE